MRSTTHVLGSPFCVVDNHKKVRQLGFPVLKGVLHNLRLDSTAGRQLLTIGYRSAEGCVLGPSRSQKANSLPIQIWKGARQTPYHTLSSMFTRYSINSLFVQEFRGTPAFGYRLSSISNPLLMIRFQKSLYFSTCNASSMWTSSRTKNVFYKKMVSSVKTRWEHCLEVPFVWLADERCMTTLALWRDPNGVAPPIYVPFSRQ